MPSPTRIVTAYPPSKRMAPRKPAAKPPAAPGKPAAAVLPALTPQAALAAFHGLIAAWKIAPARAWRMLTGVGWQAGSLTPDQADRVAHLVAIDAAMQEIGGQPVGTWMVRTNPAPLLAGSAPVDYLTRRGLPGYVDLLRQVRRWAAL